MLSRPDGFVPDGFVPDGFVPDGFVKEGAPVFYPIRIKLRLDTSKQ